MADLAVLGNRLIEASAYMTGYNTFKLVLDYEDEDGKIRTYDFNLNGYSPEVSMTYEAYHQEETITFNMVPSKKNEIFKIEVN